MTTMPQAVIDRVTLIVSDLDRAEDDYVRTFGCTVEHRADIDPSPRPFQDRFAASNGGSSTAANGF